MSKRGDIVPEVSPDASEFPGVTRRQIAEIDAYNDWLRTALSRCKTQEQRAAVNAKAWASQAHRLVKIDPRCQRCGWVMTQVDYRGRLIWAWDYSKPKKLEPDTSAEQLCPDCDPG